MAWFEIMPGYERQFHGWNSAASFLAWTGILVNRHRHRQVERVELEPSARFYVKKEFAVTWRDRLRNAWDGFGWCATAVREAAMLQALRKAGIGCPEAVALGEDHRRAFVVTRAEPGMTDLRVILATLPVEARHRVAEALGRELARMHDAGFEHPDLFAKHILVDVGGEVRICILDGQRGRRRRRLPWRARCRDLAILDATLHASLAGDQCRLRCLRAYRGAASGSPPPLRRLAERIRRLALRLRENRNIREIGQLPVGPGDQEFVQLNDGRLLVVRAYFERMDGQIPNLCTANSPDTKLQTWPAGDAAWEIPELAHTLFRLHRFGVAAPRLRAVGRTDDCIFVNAEQPSTTPLVEALAKASSSTRARLLESAGAIVRRIHEAGYRLPAGDSWVHRFGVTIDGAVVVTRVEPIERTMTSWQELGPQEIGHDRAYWSDGEERWFLRGYLGADVAAPGAREGQVAS